jgi:hypothetical protein
MNGSALGIYMIDIWAQDYMECYEQVIGASLWTKQAPSQAVAAAAIKPLSSACRLGFAPTTNSSFARLTQGQCALRSTSMVKATNKKLALNGLAHSHNVHSHFPVDAGPRLLHFSSSSSNYMLYRVLLAYRS